MDIETEKIRKLIEDGKKPTKKDFIENPTLLYYDDIVSVSLEQDPSIIVLLKGALLNQRYCDIIVNQNMEITEEIIKQNPSLTKYKNVMEKAILLNPSTIRYTHCHISKETINQALQSYQIKKEDFLNNPYLMENEYILEQNPELDYYFMYPIKIIELKETIEQNPLNIKDLEIFKDKQNYVNKIIYLVTKLNELEGKIDQNQSYDELMTIIDRITEIRYKKEKHNFEYTDIISINYKMIRTFEKIIETNNTTLLNNLGKQLFEFTNEKMPYGIIKTKITEYYKEYIEKKSLNIDKTNDFCNQILNYHRDYYKSNEQEQIILELKQALQLTKKKINQIHKSRKINKLTEIIKNKQIDSLGIENYEKKLMKALSTIKKDLETNKDIIKNNIEITPEMFLQFEELFKENGTLTIEQVKNITNCNNKEIVKYIANKYERIKLKFVDKVKIEDRSINKEARANFGFNINNFVINDKEKNNFTLAMMIHDITEEELDLILQNEEYFDDFKKIIPFCNISQELTLSTIKKIFTQYGKIVEQEKEVLEKHSLYENMDTIIMCAKGLNKNNTICIDALGKNIIEKVGESYSSDYLEMYLKMLRKNYSHIPSVNLKYKDIELKSGDYFNPERLLIGKYPPGSCIDLNNVAGEKTYKECLLKPESDVILLRKDNVLFDRILAFRRGNVIQLVTQNEHEYPLEMYEQIKNQMLGQMRNDNIDYIVVNENSLEEKNLKTLTDGRFTTYFPHADTTEKVYVLYGNDNKFRFSASKQGKYYKKRKEINYSPTIEEIKRLLALNAYIKKIEPMNIDLNKKVICGEDWILIENNNEIKEIMLNQEDIIAKQEMENAKEILKENDKHL